MKRHSGIPTTTEEHRRAQDEAAINGYKLNRTALEKAVAEAQTKLDDAEDDDSLAWAWQGLTEALTDLAKMEARYRYARRRQAWRAEQAEKQEREKASGG